MLDVIHKTSNLLAGNAQNAESGRNFAPEGEIVLPSYNDPKYPTGFNFENATIGEIIGKLLLYIYVVAGLILLLMLISGGLTLMTSAGNPEKSKAGYGRITGALIGFAIIFVSYFIALIVEKVLGVKFM